MKKIAEKFYQKPILFNICVAIVLNVLLETMARGSLIKCLSYIIGNPGKSIFNVLIILLPLTLTMLFRRRLFYTVLVSLLWFALGFTNLMLLTFRSTPFSAVDFKLVSTALDVFDVYLSSWQIVLIIAAAIMAIALTVLLWIKAPKFEGKRNFAKALAFPAVTALGVFLLNSSAVHAETVSFANLAEAYENYGFAYCFSVSVVDSGMKTPSNYSEETVNSAVSELSEEKEPESTPNIIFIQLESFFDVNNVVGLEFEENPLPTFEYLKENYTSGLLTVPCVGAGTANTEFEMLTGMSISFFGAGEYPFKTVMTDTTTESMAYSLSKYGYTPSASHNHRGTFYGRNTVYANLGFNSFTPIEYMLNVEKTEKNWAKDAVLTDVIMETLNSTEEQDYIFSVSVQAHGQYPTAVKSTTLNFEAIGPEGEDKTAVEYYVQQISEVDDFLAELTQTLEAYDEDVVLVLYGDHLPSISYFNEFEYGNRYTTEYIVWSNFDLAKQDKDLCAYQLSAYVQELLGMNAGVITKYHQDNNYSNTEEYMEGLQLLQYDLLMGEGYAYGDAGQYEATDMSIGINDIVISNVSEGGDTIYVMGENFTKYSGIYVDGEAVTTKYHTSGVLTMSASDIAEGQEITIGQRNKDRYVLSYTEPFVFKAVQIAEVPLGIGEGTTDTQEPDELEPEEITPNPDDDLVESEDIAG